MTFTFGICTTFEDIPRLNKVIQSIVKLQIPQVEILVAGSYGDHNLSEINTSVQYVMTDGWLPKKKNLIAKMAQHEVLVLLHDYFEFDPGWFRAYEDFGYAWDVCSNPQYLITGHRHFTDWVNWSAPKYPRYHSFDYEDWSHTKHQYISGGYFLVKRDFLRAHPLNEGLTPGSPEDVEWSLRIRDVATIVCNPGAQVRHNKIHRDVGMGMPINSNGTYVTMRT